ncbi:hypothetical protein [Mycetocola sp. JXN-3]|uniref:hypothetical protein n=1 Tax=Mycetocola sp. JXN-3 TaxID=2116510 RepID=UPI00165D2208|nr:hypothetical protein [Mycetocola sp. JXN-3]
MTTPEGPNVPEEFPAEASSTESKKSRTGLWIGIGIAVLVVIAVVIAVVSGAFSGGKTAESPSPSAEVSASASASPSPSATPSETPIPSASPTAPVRVAVPTDCKAVFTPAFLQKIEGDPNYPLNNPDVGQDSSRDEQIIALTKTLEPRIFCSWGGPSESGANTTVAAVTDAQAATVNARMADMGATCTEVDGGTRCVFSRVRAENHEQYGMYAGVVESSFTRDGLWISTEQVNFLSEDYLQDSITAIFGN